MVFFPNSERSFSPKTSRVSIFIFLFLFLTVDNLWAQVQKKLDVPDEPTYFEPRCYYPKTAFGKRKLVEGEYPPKFPPGSSLQDLLGTKDPKVDLSAALDSTEEDQAGTQNVFNPGPGLGNTTTADWNWTALLYLKEPKRIESMILLHGVLGEGWSTTATYIDHKLFYPLVVFANEKKLTREYDQRLGRFTMGRHDFKLYGQKESTPFAGGVLLVLFTDQTYAEAKIAPQPRDGMAGGPTSLPLPEFDYSNIPVGFPKKEVPRFNLGRIWHVKEGIWKCTWRRRGQTDVFDATATNPQGISFNYEVKFDSVKDNIIRLYRTDTHGYYQGVLSADKRRIVDGEGDWFIPGDRWSARIE